MYENSLFVFLVENLIELLIIALIPAYIAKRKGRNFKRWYIYAVLLWIVAMIHSLLLSDHSGIKCPSCGSEDIDCLQRITGYLVGTTNRWNGSKLAELKDRVVHQ